MVRHDTFSAMVACRLLMYSIMGCSPADSSAATTRVYYHSPPAPRVSVIPVIRLAARWWNPSSNFSIDPVTTQLSLTYSSTAWSTALYIIPRDRNVAPVFSNTPHDHPPPPPRFLRVLIHRRPIAAVVGYRISKVREGLRKWQDLCIDL